MKRIFAFNVKMDTRPPSIYNMAAFEPLQLEMAYRPYNQGYPYICEGCEMFRVQNMPVQSNGYIDASRIHLLIGKRFRCTQRLDDAPLLFHSYRILAYIERSNRLYMIHAAEKSHSLLSISMDGTENQVALHRTEVGRWLRIGSNQKYDIITSKNEHYNSLRFYDNEFNEVASFTYDETDIVEFHTISVEEKLQVGAIDKYVGPCLIWPIVNLWDARDYIHPRSEYHHVIKFLRYVHKRYNIPHDIMCLIASGLNTRL